MKRLISAFTAFLMLASMAAYSASGSYLENYEFILPKDYYDYPEFEWEVEHGLAVLPGTVTGAANLWFRYEGGADGEAWPEEYLEVFDGYTKDRALGTEGLTLYGYEWEKDRLVVDFGVIFDVEYCWHVGNSYTELWGPEVDDYTDLSTNGLVLTVRDKESGKLLRVVEDDMGPFVPELRYDHYNASVHGGNGLIFLSYEEAKAYEEEHGMELSYTSECGKTVSFTLPEEFDPDTCELELHYMEGERIHALSDEPSEFSDPFEISLDGYIGDPVTSTGPEDYPALSFTLDDEVPEEYARYFERLLAEPSADETLAVKMSSPGFAHDIFTAHLTRAADRADPYGPKTRNAMLMIAVRDKEQKDILALHTFGWSDYLVTTVIVSDILPAVFDPELHEVVAVNYAIDYSGEGAPEYYVGEPLVIDRDKCIFGDADKDSVVNLRDVTLILKRLTHWDSVKTEMPDQWGYQPYSAMDVSAILKTIAGWDRTLIFEESDMMSLGLHIGTSAAVRYYTDR